MSGEPSGLYLTLLANEEKRRQEALIPKPCFCGSKPGDPHKDDCNWGPGIVKGDESPWDLNG